MIEIILPFPEKVLHPNSGAHWKAKIEAKESARDYGKYIALKHVGKFKRDEKLHLTLDFSWVDNRRRDLDNALSSLKHHIDGIFIGLGLDDSQVHSITLNKNHKSEKSEILLTLEKL